MVRAVIFVFYFTSHALLFTVIIVNIFAPVKHLIVHFLHPADFNFYYVAGGGGWAIY